MWFINLSHVLTVCCSEPAVCCRFPFQNRDVLRLLTDTFGLKHVQTPLQHSSCPLLSVPWVLQLYHPRQTDERANSQSVVHQMIFSVISLWPKRVSSWDVKMKRSLWWTLAVHGTRVPFSFSPTTLPFSCYQPGLYLSSSSSEVIWCLYCTFYSHQTSLEVWLFFGALRKVLRKAFPSNLMEHRLVWCDCCHSKVAYYSVAFSPQAAERVFSSSRVEIITLFQDFNPLRMCGCKQMAIFLNLICKWANIPQIFDQKILFFKPSNDPPHPHYQIQPWHPAGISSNLQNSEKKQSKKCL